MNAPKPIHTMAGTTCRECGQGKFGLVQITHIEKIPGDNAVTVADVWVDRCNHCGETLFPGETIEFIESMVAEMTEQLTCDDLERARNKLGVVRQDDMSEILGLGEKTFHKWESGSQLPTRSMCYYIRVLAEFPHAFDWLKRRGWRSKNCVSLQEITSHWSSMFPDLPPVNVEEAKSPSRVTFDNLHPTPSQPRHRNPALGLLCADFQSK